MPAGHDSWTEASGPWIVGMVVAVEIASALRREARQREGPLAALVRSEGAPEVTAAAVRTAIEAFEASDEPLDRATPLQVQETMKGPAVILADAEPTDMLPVLERLAQRLTDAGLTDAVLTSLPRVNPLGRDTERAMSAIKCWIVFRGHPAAERPPGVGSNMAGVAWEVDAGDRLAALRALAGWTTALPASGATAAVTGTGTGYVPVPLSEAFGFMHRTVEGPKQILYSNRLVVTAGTQFRSLDVRMDDGFASVAQGVRNGAVLDWEAVARDMRQLVTGLGAWAGYAHLTRGQGSMSTSSLAPDGDRNIGNPMASESRKWAEFVTAGGYFDAYPVMRLPADRRRQVERLWTVTELPDGHILAEHPNPAAWFAQIHTDPATLHAARHALGNALADRSHERIYDYH